MSGWSNRWVRAAVGLGFLLLLTFFLRPLQFFRHYSAHLFHLRTGHPEHARVPLFRAVHFNPVSTMLKWDQKEKILNAVFFQAVGKDDFSEILDLTAPVFPFEMFRKGFTGNPWFQIILKA